MPSIAGIKAGNAYVVIGAIDDTGKMLAKIGRNIRKWGSGLQNLGIDLAFKTALGLTPAAMGLQTFMKFDDLMKQTQARTGATNAQMETLSETARKVGRDIGLTATQIAEIFAELSTKDFGLAEMDKMVRPIALLAKATGNGSDKDMKQAGALMSQTLQAFHLDAGQATRVADVLTVVANKSNFALDDLAEAMSHVSSTAAMMGMTFEETIAIMAQMRNVGIQAESASIGLRNIILNAANAKEVTKFNDVLKSLGIQTVDFSDAMGNLENPTKLLFTIMDRIKNLGSQTRISLLEGLFGKRAINPAAAAGGAKLSFDELMKAIQGAGGESTKIARQMETGIGGVWRRMVNTVHDLAITYGKVMTPALTLAGHQLEKLVTAASKWIAVHPMIVVGITAVTVGLFGLAGALIVTGLAFKAIAMVIIPLGLALTLLKTTITVVVVVLSSLVSVLWTLGSALVTTVITAMLNFGQAVMWLGPIVMGLFGIVVNLIALFLEFTAFAPPLIAMFVFWGVVIAAVELAIWSLTDGVDILAEAINGLIDMGRIFSSIFSGAFKLLGEELKSIGAGFQFLKSSFNTLLSSIVNGAQTMKLALGIAFDLADFGEFKSAWEVIVAGIKVSLLDLRNTLQIIFEDLLGELEDHFALLPVKARMMAVEAITAVEDPKALPGLQKANAFALGGAKGLLAGQRAVANAPGRNDRENERIAAAMDLNVLLGRAAAALAGKDPNGRLSERIKALFQGLGAGGTPLPSASEAMLKPLEGLEKGTLEAAKAVYEASVNGDGDVNQQQLRALQGIEVAVNELNVNLGVA